MPGLSSIAWRKAEESNPIRVSTEPCFQGTSADHPACITFHVWRLVKESNLPALALETALFLDPSRRLVAEVGFEPTSVPVMSRGWILSSHSAVVSAGVTRYRLSEDLRLFLGSL